VSQQINLYTPLLLKKRIYFSALAMVQGLGIITVGMIAGYGALLYESNILRSQERKAQVDFTATLAQFNALGLGKGTGSGQAIQDEITRLESQRKRQSELLEGLSGADIGNTEGFSKYLAAFARQPVQGLWLTGFSIGGPMEDVTISGRAKQADILPRFIRQLRNEEVLRGRRFSEVQVIAVEEPAKNQAGAAAKAAGRPLGASENAKVQYVSFKLSSAQGTGRAP